MSHKIFDNDLVTIPKGKLTLTLNKQHMLESKSRIRPKY